MRRMVWIALAVMATGCWAIIAVVAVQGVMHLSAAALRLMVEKRQHYGDVHRGPWAGS